MDIITFVLGTLIFAGLLWGGVWLVDRYNSRNSLATAAIIGAFFGFAAPALGVVFMALPLIALLYLLVSYYDLGIVRSLIVLTAMIAGNIALAQIVGAVSRAIA